MRKKTYAEMKESGDLARLWEKRKKKALAKMPLGRSVSLKRASKPMKRVSTKQTAKNRLYAKQRIEYLTGHPICEWPGCNAIGTDIHHTKGRGIHTCDPSTFKSACRYHHDYCHFTNPKEARSIGWLI